MTHTPPERGKLEECYSCFFSLGILRISVTVLSVPMSAPFLAGWVITK